jgi:cephalosporin hydroxylase
MRPERNPDISWVARLSGRSYREAADAVERAAAERNLFQHIEREHTKEGRDSYVEIDAPLELHALVQLQRPIHVVEVGVSSGVSSAYLLAALGRNGSGTLHSVDLPARPRRRGGRSPRTSWSLPPGRQSGWAVPPPLREGWDLRLGDKSDVLPLLAQELPRIDLLVYDVPHRDEDTRAELQLLHPLLRRGSVVIIDHGPGGGLCSALRAWAATAGTRPVRRVGLGLYGARRLYTPRKRGGSDSGVRIRGPRPFPSGPSRAAGGDPALAIPLTRAFSGL